MAKIQNIQAREILASGGEPSLEVSVLLEDGSWGEASVSYGASAGSREAFVLFDGDQRRYHGTGMRQAVENIRERITHLLIGKDAQNQREIDRIMTEADGTANKSNFGANAILGVSMAVCRAAACSKKEELYRHLGDLAGIAGKIETLPKPLAVLIEGGKHADNSTDLQEFAVAVLGNGSAAENVRAMEEIYFSVRQLLKKNGFSVNVGNEGAFAPEGISDNEKPLDIITQAIEGSGRVPKKDAGIYIDAAASVLFENEAYSLKTEHVVLTAEQLMEKYLSWFAKYPIVCLEDGLSEFDWEHWPQLMARAGNVRIVADDLTVTNVALWQKAINEKAANAILIKLNQAGTVTETLDCCMLARRYGMATIPSHRGGGETNDTFLVDLGVAMGSEWIKVGPTRGERVCKYNRLMRIEELLSREHAP